MNSGVSGLALGLKVLVVLKKLIIFSDFDLFLKELVGLEDVALSFLV